MNDMNHVDKSIHDFAQRFQDFYSQMTMSDIDRLGDLYAQDVVFTDPIHTVNGLAGLTEYYRKTFSSVSSFDFSFIDAPVLGDQTAVFDWQMTFTQKRLNGGRPIVLPGISKVKYHQNKICTHRDYYDLGKMVYEHIPLFGKLVTKFRRSVA